MKIIGAKRAGDYGLRVAGRRATLIQNRGGEGGGYIEESTLIVLGKTNADAEEKGCRRWGIKND